MKRKINKFLVAGVLIGMIFSLVGVVLVSQAKGEPVQRKIVVFKPGVLGETAREALVKNVGGVKIKDLKIIEGKAVLLSSQSERALVRQAGVLRIDDDVEVFALENPFRLTRTVFTQSQTLPWGVDRIDAEKVWTTSTGDLVKVAIIDTGIYLTHPDLAANIKGGVSTVAYTTRYTDDNGHGTHVAGIAAALNNTIGVVGVGPKIDLYAVKVLDRYGSGHLSDVIEGLDWAIANGMQVVNMSLGTSVYNASFEEAVKRVYTAGIVQVAAAGNSGPGDNTVIYPAKFTEVIAVSAADKTDTVAYFSSRGPEVDLTAPGVSIYSTWLRPPYYKTLSGTSMAAPHVAGVVALVLSVPDKCQYLLDDIPGCSPAEVQKRLEATAEDLGAVGKDNLYGSGLVDAEKAVK